MNTGQTVFSQIFDHVPRYEFTKCVNRYRGDYQQKRFSCWDQFLSMAFAQLTYRESLRDIEACLRSMSSKLYHMGFRATVARSTLADANESRDWRIYADARAGPDRHCAAAVCARPNRDRTQRESLRSGLNDHRARACHCFHGPSFAGTKRL